MKRLVTELKPHPRNDAIYGDTADETLVASVRENGILEPLLIDRKDRIISGHRRWDAAKQAKLKDVPVEVFKSEDELEIRTALVEANRQRIKTNEQVAREAVEIYAVEKDKANERQREAGKQGKKKLPVILPEAGDARDLAGERLGMSGKKVELAVQVIDAIDRLKEEGSAKQAEALRVELNKFSVSRAHKVAREAGQLKGVAEEKMKADEDYFLVKDWKRMDEKEKQKALAKEYPPGKFNTQESGSIEWAQWSWNPLTGCDHGCKYCYARDIANRLFAPKFEPAFYPGRLHFPKHTKQPGEAKTDVGFKNVFTCSMADLFGKWVPSDMIELVLDVVRENSKWNFLFLTKFPQRYAEFEFPDNAWVGTSVDKQSRVKNAEEAFKNVKANVKWLSCEPMMERLTFKHLERFQWIVVGGSSRSTQTPEFHPQRDWVTHLWSQARKAGCMIYEKPNLLERCREYPQAKKAKGGTAEE